MISSIRSRFCRWRTTLIVSGKPSSRARCAASIFFEKDFVPPMRSELTGSLSWIEIWTLSRPASFSASARLRVNGVPAGIRLLYSPAALAARVRISAALRTSGSPPVSASWSTPSSAASPNTRHQSSVGSSSAYLLSPIESGFEQYGQWSGHLYDSSAMRRSGLGVGIDDHSPVRELDEEVLDVVVDVGAAEAGAELVRDVLDRALSVAQLEDHHGGVVQRDRALRKEHDVTVADLVEVQPEAVR